MRGQMLYYLVAAFSLSLNGCGLGDPDKPVIPIISTNALPFWPKGDVYTEMTAITADRRVVIMAQNLDSNSSIRKILTCAEAPPDVALSFSSDLQASLAASADVVGDVASPKVSAAFRDALAVAAMALTQRSQGLQLYRDSSFQTCQAYVNGIYNADQYRNAMASNMALAVDLIKQQLDKLPELAKLSAPAVTGAGTIGVTK